MAQSLSKIYIHLVFSTKMREKSILHREEMYSYVAGVLNRIGCEAIIVGGMCDHIHALFTLNRTATISDVVREVKSSAAMWYGTKIGRNFGWQHGYGAFSVSQSVVENVRNYILNQEVHHTKQTFQEEYREILGKYRIAFDERFVWE